MLDCMYVSLDSVNWYRDYPRAGWHGVWIMAGLPHKKKIVQITDLYLVPKLRMIEATGLLYMASWC